MINIKKTHIYAKKKKILKKLHKKYKRTKTIYMQKKKKKFLRNYKKNINVQYMQFYIFIPEVWKTRQFDDILLRQCNTVYSQNRIERWTKGCIIPFPKKRWPRTSQELPRDNTYIHSSQNLQCPTVKPHRTQNRQHP